MGKHSRPRIPARHRKPGTARQAAAKTAAAASGTIAAGVILAAPAYAVTSPPDAPSGVTVESTSLHAVPVTFQAAREVYAVGSNDTLSGISGRHCGTTADWSGIYDENKKVIGPDPDLIRPGQELVLDCRVASIPVVATAAHVAPSQGHHHYAVASAYHAAGIYSFAGLEQLWVAAGGPAWAERSAAAVAECESGGRANAYNPSGATGLWQILGAVRPGSLTDPMANAVNAVAKFEASGDTWAQWVCKP